MALNSLARGYTLRERSNEQIFTLKGLRTEQDFQPLQGVLFS